MHKSSAWPQHRQAAAQAGRARKRFERDPWHDMREPGSLTLRVNGYVFDLLLEPDPHDIRRWKAYRDGEPFARGGLEVIWRAIQAEMAPVRRMC